MERRQKESRDMNKHPHQQDSADTPSSDDNALLTRLGLLLGDHRVSTVKTQSHNHPILNHSNHASGYLSNERRKKSHLTTSPASTLSDKGIGSSVGSFDSEHFRNNLSALTERNTFSSRTGSLDSRNADIVSHSRSDSGIPTHSRSSSDLIYSDNRTDVTEPRLAQQASEKLWNADPRRNSGNAHTLNPGDFRSRRSSASKSKKSDRSSHSSRERLDSASEVMKLPQLCLDSPNNSTAPSTHSSVSSSRSVTPAASVLDMTNGKGIRRTVSSHSNGTAVFESDPLPPPPPPPPASNDYYSEYNEDLPPPPPPPPNEEPVNNHSRASSSDRTLSCEDFQSSNLIQREDSRNESFLPSNYVTGKPPISRPHNPQENGIARGNHNVTHMQPPVPAPRTSRQLPAYNDTPTMIQRLRSSAEVNKPLRPMTVQNPDGTIRGRPMQREWPQQTPRDGISVMHDFQHRVSASMPAMMITRADSASRLANTDAHSATHIPTMQHQHGGDSPYLWEESRPHSLSTPVVNPMLQNLDHRPSASIDNSYFSRRSSNRSSTRSNPSKARSLSNASSSSDMRSVRFAPHKGPEVNLHSLQFELPFAVTSEVRFVGREWVFGEIMNALNTANSKINKGVVVMGSEGRGKTSLIHQLEALSYHGNKKIGPANSVNTLNRTDNELLHRIGSMNLTPRSGSPVTRPPYQQSNNSSRTASPAFGHGGSKPGSRSGSQTSLSGDEAQKRLASQVVAYHYCQADNNTTCYVPEFLHSIAAQLAAAPQLTAYREMLLVEPHLQTLLSTRSCIQNPRQALFKAIFEPLTTLRLEHKIPRLNLIILLDGIGEAEQHRPDHGDSISTFLQRHLPNFPEFIKILATCRTEDKALLESLPLYLISLDMEDNKTHVTRDAQAYVNQRTSMSSTLSSLAITGKPDAAVSQKLLSNHLVGKCQGNMLYLRLTLDLIESGKLVPKSSGFKVVPVNLSETFLFLCNVKFSSASTFARVRDILAVALASLYPLKDEEIYQAVSSGLLSNDVSGEEFQRLMDSVSKFLVLRFSDERRSFFHPCFREWLSHGSSDENQMGTLSSSKKFSVDPKRGHALLATVLSRQPPSRLNEYSALELGHHLLKARMFRGQSKTTGMNSSDLHAVWMAQCSHHLSESLVTIRNLFYPNIKVSKLLLKSGANPNMRSQVLCDAPAICVAAHIGSGEFAELLLMHRASIDFSASNGMTALAYAAAGGHFDVVKLLMKFKPRLDLVDKNGHSPLLHAISNGHNNIAVLLLTCELYVSPEQRFFSAQQALIAAATTGNKELIQYLLDHPDPALHCDVNCIDPTRRESSLTAAAIRGKSLICEYLVRERGASIEQRNGFGMTPLLCAVKQGEWETADLLLNMGAMIEGADFAGRTPLVTAASCGSLGVLELLLSRGANLNAVDKEGLTALGWAALKGHLPCVKSLLSRGSDVHRPDNQGRTALNLAAFFGDEKVVDLLLDSGSNIAQVDDNNMTALDCAVRCQNVAVVALLLKRGSDITPTSWKWASDKRDVTTAIFDKCVLDANDLYKEGRFLEARDLYSRALNHVGEPMVSGRNGENPLIGGQGHLRDLTSVLLLGLARCARKLSDLDTADIAASRAIDLKSSWYEALYVRARVRRETSRLSAALQDAEEAERNAPAHNKKEITRLIERIKEEMKRGERRNSVSDGDNPVRPRHNSFSGQVRPTRVSSTSSYRGTGSSRSSSPSQSSGNEVQCSQSYQPHSHMRNYPPQPVRHDHLTPDPRQLPHLYPDGAEIGIVGSHSQDNLVEPRMGLTVHPSPHPQVPYQHWQNGQQRRRYEMPIYHQHQDDPMMYPVRRPHPDPMVPTGQYMQSPAPPHRNQTPTLNNHDPYRDPRQATPQNYRRTVATEL